MHKHLPEMKAIAGLSYEPFFSPIVSDFYSGMVVTVPVLTRILEKKYTAHDIWEILSEHYENQKLISVLPFGTEGFLGANNMSGKDSMEIIVSGNDERVLIASRFDNLGKGASGAAVQCFNLISGKDEAEGLVL
jgi:N-acetyl-gamma-glutamyl-phosphate reductase